MFGEEIRDKDGVAATVPRSLLSACKTINLLTVVDGLHGTRFPTTLRGKDR